MLIQTILTLVLVKSSDSSEQFVLTSKSLKARNYQNEQGRTSQDVIIVIVNTVKNILTCFTDESFPGLKANVICGSYIMAKQNERNEVVYLSV